MARVPSMEELNESQHQMIGDLLTEELHLFRNVFKETSEFVRDLDRFSLNRLTELLQHRKQWVDELMFLETRRQYVNCQPPDELKAEISEILRNLVSIDAQLLDFLKMRKQAVIKDLTQIADNQNRSLKRCSLKDEPKIIDLLQE